MKVYVIYHNIYEEIICVHSEPNKKCKKCIEEIMDFEREYVSEFPFLIVSKFVEDKKK
jgi:hypothetical protein